MTPDQTRTIARLRRILSVVPFLANHPGIATDEVCAHFGIDRRTLLDDLNLIWLCGLPPYSPNDLFEVDIDDDTVLLRGVDPLARPRGLRRLDAVRLLASGKAALALPGMDDATLRSAVVKLEAALGEEAVEIDIEAGDDDRVLRLKGAVAERAVVRMTYWSYGRDVESERTVEPLDLFVADGHWYLEGFCRGAGANRTFRVDRIRDLEVLPEPFARRGPVRRLGYTPGDDDLHAVIVLGPGARWAAEHYPLEARNDLGDGRTEVEIAAPSASFLVRLLLRLGEHAAVVSPPWLAGAVADLAGAVLDLYERTDSPEG